MEETRCWDCTTGILQLQVPEEYTFPYGNTTLRATFPVLRCNKCGVEFTNWRAEEAKDAAVAAYKKAKSHD